MVRLDSCAPGLEEPLHQRTTAVEELESLAAPAHVVRRSLPDARQILHRPQHFRTGFVHAAGYDPAVVQDAHELMEQVIARRGRRGRMVFDRLYGTSEGVQLLLLDPGLDDLASVRSLREYSGA